MEQQLSKKCRINLSKPTYIWTGILDLSKVLMQDFHYNDFKNKYDGKAEILLTDTDSLTNKIETEIFLWKLIQR